MLRRTLAALAGPLLLAPPLGAAELPDLLPLAVHHRAAEADAVRAAFGRGVAPGILEALARFGDIPASAPSLPTPGHVELTVTSSLPVGLGAPVAGLLAAIRSAASELGEIDREQARRAGDAFLGSLSAWMLRGGPLLREAPPPGSGERPDAPRAASISFPEVGPTVARAARGSVLSAVLVAAAIDRYLPAIRSWRGAVTRVPAANGCDVADQAPVLCVGSDLDGVYTENTLLTVDLGGADRHVAGAGSAPFRAEDRLVGVSVVVEVGGDDRYEPGAAALSPVLAGTINAQGAGAMGGTGVLVDAAGDDVYSAAAPAPAPGGGTIAMAQGAAVGGTGVLVDLAGNDRFTVTAPDGTSEGSQAIGQGLAAGCAGNQSNDPPNFGCSLGVLADLGSGDDAYALDAGRVAGPGGGRVAAGQGYGSFGLGLLLDDGGRDALTALAGAEQDGPRDFRTAETPTALVSGQGWGSAGAGVLLTGDGPTAYRADAQSTGISWNIVRAQGGGLVQGVGVLDDAGGDDVYDLRAEMTYDLDVTVDDACTTIDEETGGEIRCPRADVAVDGYRSTITNSVDGQGFSSFQSVGLLHDHGGDDRYAGQSLSRMTVRLQDRLSQPAQPPLLSVLGYDSPALNAQGAGTGFTVTAALVDESGNDDYRFVSHNLTEASATSEHAEGEPQVTAESQARIFIAGQGSADFGGFTATMLDLGGVGDRVEAVMENPARTEPDPDGGYRAGLYWPYVQGAFGGVFAVLGESPLVLSHPSRPVCITSPGRRGFGEWNDCAANADDTEHEQYDAIPIWTHHTLGLAPDATGREPRIEFLPESAASGQVGGRIDVAARLLDPDGTPIAGAPLRFDVQYGCTILCTAGWVSYSNQWEAQAVTDGAGVARARLPLRIYDWQSGYVLPPWQWRVLATYDGGLGLYPRHVATPLTLTQGG